MDTNDDSKGVGAGVGGWAWGVDAVAAGFGWEDIVVLLVCKVECDTLRVVGS